MKKGILAIFGLFSLLLGCKKGSDDGSGGGGTTLSAYMSTTTSSSWQYEQVNNPSSTPTTTNYTVTSTSRDSTINGKPYHVYTNSNTGGSEYYNITGAEYYQYRSVDLPASLTVGKIEALYLKDNVDLNGSWSQNITVTVSGIPITLTLTYTVIEKNTTKVVRGITYTEVIGVKTVITPATPGIPASAITGDIKSYYARKVGLIQNDVNVTVNYAGINQTTESQIKLKTADIR